MGRGLWQTLRPLRPVSPRPGGARKRDAEPPKPRREPVQARVEVECVTEAGEALDALAAAVFAGEAGRARVAPLLARFDAEVGALEVEDDEFDLLQVSRMDWALCDTPAAADARPGDTWAWRAITGGVAGLDPERDLRPSAASAARSIVGLFEVYGGEPTWIRDRVSGLVLRLLDAVGPFPPSEVEGPVALWELRLVPDASGGFRIARVPIDYPLDLLDTLEDTFARRFEAQPWPTLMDLRRARLRHLRAGKRTPVGRMLRWR